VTTCVVMQPTYLPWSGYFNLMAAADVFVLLDDVQFNRNSWQSRNRILSQGAELMLSVPVRAEHLDTRIQDVRLAPGPWRRKHMTSIREAYGRAPHGPDLIELLRPAYESACAPELLTDWNQQLISMLAEALDIYTPLVRASTLGCEGTRSAHVLNICTKLSCNEYLSPRGSAEYLAEDGFERNTSIALRFQAYSPAPYAQRKTSAFVSHLSVVDVIAHQGLEFARRYIRSSLT
jgi:hypothetical protein